MKDRSDLEDWLRRADELLAEVEKKEGDDEKAEEQAH